MIAQVRSWEQYQEDVAEFFRSLGFDADTNVTVHGARGDHLLDVLVTFRAGGITVTWVVECKQWRRSVPKERVLVLDGIVKDVGADRGLLVAESGYQAGAVRAAQHTNTTLTSLADLRENADEERTKLRLQIHMSRIAQLTRRVSALWPWTQPQTHHPRFDYKELLEPAGSVFEVQTFVLPKLVDNALPITLAAGGERRTARTAEELDELLATELSRLEQELVPFELLASAARREAAASVGRLRQLVHELLAAGRAFDQPLQDGAALAETFVEVMRAVSDEAKQLGEVVPERVRQHVCALMRHLIDHTYVVTERAQPNWGVEQEVLSQLIASVETSLAECSISGSDAQD